MRNTEMKIQKISNQSLSVFSLREMEEELVQLPTHPHLLRPCNFSDLFFCSMCYSVSNPFETDGYVCTTCDHQFHKECLESPMEIQHPPHPPHPLSLRLLRPHKASQICSFCREQLIIGRVYHCSLCDLFMHFLCAKKPPVLVEEQPKSHDHKLSLLPKPRPFTCDACGLMLSYSTFPYACLQCGVMLHRECMDLPRLVRISRHQHRLSYSSSPSPSREVWSCGVCRRVVHNDYGAYSCSRGCHYTVHSKCATRKEVWDGKDLYGEPEEPEDVEEPFEVIDDNVICHFSHGHHLRLDDSDGAGFHGGKHCGICALPTRFHSGNIYSCTHCDCDFVLHETCANLPRKIWHMLHPHRLKLEAVGRDLTACNVCAQYCCGFLYRCLVEGCEFEIDVHCASVSEPFTHNGHHQHPLFCTATSMGGPKCSGCRGRWRMMLCMECDYGLCFRCATLPPTIRYKEDEHPLVLRGGEDEAKGTYWCEICEGKMNSKVLFYTCDSCCVTVHVECILGKNHLMKPGRYVEFCVEFEVVANISCVRPLCHRCRKRCPFPIAFKKKDLCFCTYRCLVPRKMK